MPYNQTILKYFLNPKNVGQIENPDATATEGSPACGDMVKLYLKVDPETLVIQDIKFQSYGCASNIATASIITEIAKGKTIEEAKQISWESANRELGGLPPVKIHCAVLAVDALKTAIENYEHTHGLLKEKIPTDESTVTKRLRSVINPVLGKDIISTDLVNGIDISSGTVKVHVKMKEDEQFFANVKDEIIERISPLWDIRKVEVVPNGD